MRLLNASDRYLGRAPIRRPRTDELAAVLAEVVRPARDERVDCLLLSDGVDEHKVASQEADHLLGRRTAASWRP